MKVLPHRCLISAIVVIAGLPGTSGFAQPEPGGDPDPRPVPAIEAVVSAAKDHAVVAIEDIPGCEQVHELLRSLISDPRFRAVIRDVVVDFGNPRHQPLLDRFLLKNEPVAREELRQVWRDTPRALELLTDSPVYEAFFETVHRVNAELTEEQKLRVKLAGPPIDWSKITGAGDLEPFRGAAGSRSLVEAVNTLVASHRRALVISSIPDLRATLGEKGSSRVWTIRSQPRICGADRYASIEAVESSWPWDSVAAVRATTFAALPVDGTPGAPRLQSVADALLYLGPSATLTVLWPSADTYRDDRRWDELNRRSQLIFHAPFSFARAGLDLRTVPPRDARAAAVTPAPAAVAKSAPAGVDGVEFVLSELEQHALVGLADDHRGLGFHEFLCRLVRDSRLPDACDDVVLECGNALFQPLIDRWVVKGEDVPREERKRAWKYAAMGWETADSPIYEHLIDTVREVNRKLPESRRLRVVLGDAALDPEWLRHDPEKHLHDFLTYHENAKDPRERALAASANAVLDAGRRGIMICGGGHLAMGKRPGNARALIEEEHPGEMGLLEIDFDETTPAGRVRVDGDRAVLSLGSWRDHREIAVPPRVFRDPQYWAEIDRIHQLVRHQPIDLTEPKLLDRSLLFDAPLPEWLRAAADGD
jgi:hypothetical protein